MPWQHNREQRLEQNKSKSQLTPSSLCKMNKPVSVYQVSCGYRCNGTLVKLLLAHITLLRPNAPACHMVKYKHINCQPFLQISDDFSQQYELELQNSNYKNYTAYNQPQRSHLTANNISFSSSGAGNSLHQMCKTRANLVKGHYSSTTLKKCHEPPQKPDLSAPCCQGGCSPPVCALSAGDH